MADVSDVTRTIAVEVATALFPSQAYLFGRMQVSAVGPNASVYVGWPTAKLLNDDLRAGRVHVSVFADGGRWRNVSRFIGNQVRVLTATPPTLTATASGGVITIGGTAAAGQVVGVLLPDGNLATAYAYRSGATDTPASIATGLAGVVPNSTASGAVLTITGAPLAAASVGVDQSVSTELRRQQQMVRVSIWAPSPALRDAIASTVDIGLTTNQQPLTAAGEPIFVRVVGGATTDTPTVDRIWRRDIILSVEYPTSLVEISPQMLFGGITVNGAAFNVTMLTEFTIVTEDGVSITDGANTIVAVQ